MQSEYHFRHLDSDRGGVGSKAFDFARERLVGGRTLVEASGRGVEFQAFEEGG